jgi:hypothetical protein
LNKSLLIPLALALALAFVGCSSDDDSSTNYVDRWAPSFASEIEAIQAEFDAGAPTVKLLKDTAFEDGDDPLIILSGKTLDLNSYTLKDADNNILVVQGNIADTSANKTGKVDFTTGQSYVLAPTQSFMDSYVSDAAGSLVQVNPGSASVVGTTAVGPVVSFTSEPSSISDIRLAAIKEGSVGVWIGNLTLNGNSGPVTVGGGALYVAGAVNLSGVGTVSNAGTLVVSGAVTSGTEATDIVVVSGQLRAKTLTSKGGEFGGTVTLTDPNALAAANVLTGKFAKLTGSGAATLKGNVEFTVASTILGPVTVNEAATLKGVGGLTAKGGQVSNELTINGGTLTTNDNVSLSGNGIIVLDKNGLFEVSTTGGTGKLSGASYELTGAGSVANYVANVGTLITLAGDGISAGTSQAATPLSLLFGGDETLILNFKADTTITGVAIDVSKGGSLTLAGGKKLTITGGNDNNMAGSIVAGAAAKNIAGTYGNNSYIIATIPSGSFVAGTVSDAGPVAGVGSYGTTGFDYIALNSEFVVSVGTSASGIVTELNTPANINSAASEEGSIAVFTLP